MANYTPDEVNAAVQKIVLSTVNTPTGILGDRDVSASFSDLQEAAAGVYILYFNAPFYTILLGTKRLLDLITIQAATLTALLDATIATNRFVTPISDLTPLANARSALQDLESAVTTRATGFSDIQAVPAFRRYTQNIQTFLQDAGSNVKGTSSDPTVPAGTPAIVDTPSSARTQIPLLARQLRDQSDELIRRATLLAGAMDDFAKLNLPQVAAQGVISRARGVLDDHLTNLGAQDENQRLASMRSVVLDLLTQQPLVQTYGAATAPSEFLNTSGLATAFSDALHPATPAAVDGALFGPYNIVDTSHFIKFTLDGGAPFEYPLPLGFVAAITGVLAEPFNITSDRNAVRIVFDDPNNPSPLTFDVPLTLGSTQSSTQVVADFTAVLTGSELVCERIFAPTRYDSPVTVISLGGNSARFTILGGSLQGLGIVVGNEVDILEGPDAGTTWTVTTTDPGFTFIEALGAAPVTPQPLPGVRIQVGPAARALRLRDTNPAHSLALRRAISLPATGGPPDIANAILGWTPGISVRSRPVAAKDLANNIVTSTSALSAEALFLATYYSGAAHSSPTNASIVVLAQFQGSGTITGGAAVVFTLSADLVSEVSPGDRLVIRSSTTSADVNAEGAVTAVTDTTINVTFSSPVTAGNVSIEVGPAIAFGFGAVLNILDGFNQGRYTIREPQGISTSASFELLLEQSLPIPKNGNTAVSFTVDFGQETMRFKSVLQQVTSSVEVDNGVVGTAAQYFFNAPDLPATAVGTTSWLQFATFPKSAGVGDLVQLFEDQYNIVSRELGIQSIDQSVRALQVRPNVEATFSITFDFDVPDPFGRIRVGQVANYGDFRDKINVWLALPEQQDQYFSDLARALNPVLVNANPTVSDVNNATTQLERYYSVLSVAGGTAYGARHSPPVDSTASLEFALDEYTSPAESSVDALLATFRSKGSDRAIDLLLEGQFTTFFGLDIDDVSYSGALTKGVRSLAMNDLPVRKFNRRQSQNQTLIGSIPQEKDFEFDTSDADSPNAPDPPAAPDVSSPGENF